MTLRLPSDVILEGRALLYFAPRSPAFSSYGVLGPHAEEEGNWRLSFLELSGEAVRTLPENRLPFDFNVEDHGAGAFRVSSVPGTFVSFTPSSNSRAAACSRFNLFGSTSPEGVRHDQTSQVRVSMGGGW